MKRIRRLLTSSIGRKFLMGATGLSLIAFLIGHVSGNLLIFAGEHAFNAYGHALISNPMIYVAEAGLLLLFVSHFVTGIVLTKENRDARPIGYQRNDRAGGASRKSLASTTMILSGLVLLAFVPLHVNAFKFGAFYESAAEPGVRDLRRLVIETFSAPAYTAGYVIVLAIIGFHLWHGFGSAFESLGVGYSKALKRFGQALALIITVAFISIPLVIYLSEGAL